MVKTTQYQKLYDFLLRQIIDGRYQPGDLLPSESELRLGHGLSQPTVRRAVELLEEDGFVKRHQGKGSIVQKRPVGVGILSFEGDLFTSQNDSPKIYTKILKGPEITKELPVEFGFKPNESESAHDYYIIQRQRSVESKIIFYETICLPNIDLPRFTQVKFENTSFYEAIYRRYGIITTHSEQRFMAVRADVQLADQLAVSLGDPIQKLQRKFATNRPNYFIYSDLSANTDGICLFSHSA